MRPLRSGLSDKKNTNLDLPPRFVLFLFGADGRTRTGTVSLPTDFESVASANFTTSAYYLNILAQNFAFGNSSRRIYKNHYAKGGHLRARGCAGKSVSVGKGTDFTDYLSPTASDRPFGHHKEQESNGGAIIFNFRTPPVAKLLCRAMIAVFSQEALTKLYR